MANSDSGAASGEVSGRGRSRSRPVPGGVRGAGRGRVSGRRGRGAPLAVVAENADPTMANLRGLARRRAAPRRPRGAPPQSPPQDASCTTLALSPPAGAPSVAPTQSAPARKIRKLGAHRQAETLQCGRCMKTTTDSRRFVVRGRGAAALGESPLTLAIKPSPTVRAKCLPDWGSCEGEFFGAEGVFHIGFFKGTTFSTHLDIAISHGTGRCQICGSRTSPSATPPIHSRKESQPQ